MISVKNQIDSPRGGCFLGDMYKVGYAQFAQRPLIGLVRLRWDNNCPSPLFHQICPRELFWHISLWLGKTERAKHRFIKFDSGIASSFAPSLIRDACILLYPSNTFLFIFFMIATTSRGIVAMNSKDLLFGFIFWCSCECP